jgi:hypothetical protein
MIQKTLLATVLALATASGARAQQTPRLEIAGVYSGTFHVFGPECHGGGGTVSVNLKRWFGLTGDVSGCKATRFATPLGPLVSDGAVTQFNYLVGPRVSYRRTLTPYFQVLLGGAHVNSTNPYSLEGNAFAVAVGFGLEVRLTERFGIRLIQPDYLMTRFGRGNREDLRVSTGVVFALK